MFDRLEKTGLFPRGQGVRATGFRVGAQPHVRVGGLARHDLQDGARRRADAGQRERPRLEDGNRPRHPPIHPRKRTSGPRRTGAGRRGRGHGDRPPAEGSVGTQGLQHDHRHAADHGRPQSPGRNALARHVRRGGLGQPARRTSGSATPSCRTTANTRWPGSTTTTWPAC